MQTSVERRPGSKVALSVTVEPAVLKERMDRLYQKRARTVAIPGFRPGKAPRKLIDERMAPLMPRIQQEAIEAVIDATYKDALREQDIEPIEQGEIDDINVGDDQSLTYTVLVSVRPEIKLPEYTGIEVKRPVTEITDEQVAKEIENLRDRTADFGEVIDEGIQTTDYVTIDYTMSIDGEPYPEGDTTGYPLEVGTDTFFPELNEALLGVKQGDIVTVTHTYPEDYSVKELAGKTGTFEVTVQQVRRVIRPELTDEWASLISQGALPNIDALRERLKENLQAMAKQADQEQLRNDLVSKVVEGAELELPDVMVEEEIEHLMHELEHRLSHERVSLEEYAEMSNRSVDDIRNEQQLMARDMVRRSLVLQEIARREQLFVTPEELDATVQALTPSGSDVKEFRASLEKSGRLNTLASRIFHEKVLSFLESHAKIDGEEPTALQPEPEPAAPAEDAEENTES